MTNFVGSSSLQTLSTSPSSSSFERSLMIVSSFLFTVSTWYKLRLLKREQERFAKVGTNVKQNGQHGGASGRLGKLTPQQRRRILSASKSTEEKENINLTNVKVSDRCLMALTPPLPYLSDFFKCLQNPYHVGLNPTGYIALCMAENKLVIDMLAERLMQPGTAVAAYSDSTVYCYNSFLGMPVARQACAYFLAKRFLFPSGKNDIKLTTAYDNGSEGNNANATNDEVNGYDSATAPMTPEDALRHINPSNVALGSGLASVLNSLFYLLGDRGDACLIPAPYYPAFENDMELVANIAPIAVPMANPTIGPLESELDLMYMQAKSQGLNPKFVLLTNPNNPLGTIYTPAILKSTVKWARKRGLHTIVDEIYALSTHQGTNHGFQSVIRVLNNQLDDDVHMVWSISKDFGASGLRVGLIYSQNKMLLDGLSNLNIFRGVSNPIQMVVSELLTDDDFVDKYLEESRRRLVHSYQICACKLEEMVLPFVPAEAGMFVYVDCTSLLPQPTFEWEQKLFQLISDYAHVVLTPGENQRDRTPGMFRICYAWSSPEVLEVAMERLSRIVAKIRRLDWSDLNETTLREVLLA